MRPPEAETPGEKLYESWDCPQVVAKHSYESDEPDVLQLELGDVVNVSRKLPDGVCPIIVLLSLKIKLLSFQAGTRANGFVTALSAGSPEAIPRS